MIRTVQLNEVEAAYSDVQDWQGVPQGLPKLLSCYSSDLSCAPRPGWGSWGQRCGLQAVQEPAWSWTVTPGTGTQQPLSV